jgi:hypothetical protein
MIKQKIIKKNRTTVVLIVTARETVVVTSFNDRHKAGQTNHKKNKTYSGQLIIINNIVNRKTFPDNYNGQV